MSILPQSFYTRPDTVQIARDLLGKYLVTTIEGETSAGKIVETEAYLGREDRACHAWNGRRTQRTEIMYQEGGVAYVYLIYGIHDLFNVVTHHAEEPHAVLIRAIEPSEGLPVMLRRRGMDTIAPRLTAGPGILTQALGIKKIHTGHGLLGPMIWIEDRGEQVDSAAIIHSPRVGVAYAGQDALLPYRFRVQGNPWTSPAK